MKRIVICCDGTWNDPETRRVTNVVRMARAVRPVARDGAAQVVFYDWGIGTGGRFDRISGGAFGRGLDRHIQDVYRFLVHNYARHDQIFLIGFSRGAYTARSTAGFIRNCGILKKKYASMIPEAYELYRSKSRPASALSTRFRREHSRESRIKLLGVWDTVGALGVPLRMFKRFNASRYNFHDTKLSRSVEHAYHALAIDEKRKPFKPTLWATRPSTRQVAEQAWFAGVHSDIGGAYPETGLANVAFRWMADKVQHCGLDLAQDYIRQFKPDPGGRLHNSMTPLYRAMGRYLRPIGKQRTGREALHPSVLKRRDALRYRPENLLEYLR